MATVLTSALILVLSWGFVAILRAAGGAAVAGKPTSEPRSRPFIGGTEPRTHAWQRFHLRFYTMLLLFVAFEMEMMFMYPWAVVYVETGGKALAEMGMFLGILSVGLLYGWREGVFGWE